MMWLVYKSRTRRLEEGTSTLKKRTLNTVAVSRRKVLARAWSKRWKNTIRDDKNQLPRRLCQRVHNILDLQFFRWIFYKYKITVVIGMNLEVLRTRHNVFYVIKISSLIKNLTWQSVQAPSVLYVMHKYNKNQRSKLRHRKSPRWNSE